MGANQDSARLKLVHQRHGAIENLGWHLIHDGRWIHVQPRAHIAGSPDNLGDSRFVAGAQPGSNDNCLSDRVSIRPVLARHGLADDHGSARFRVTQ